MRIILFGKLGQLGWELQRTLACLGTLMPYDFPEVDFVKPESLRLIIRANNPQLIVNASAYTDVDRAESESKIASLINSTSVGVLAEEGFRLKIPLIHYSTDYVFDGTKGLPYTEEDKPNPINVYGQTKLEGEQAITRVGGAYLIFRTSWVYSTRKGGFVNKVLEWSRGQSALRIVDDQIGNPTWARMLAEMTGLLLSHFRTKDEVFPGRLSGTYHLAGDGFASRYEWAKAILSRHPETRNESPERIKPAKTTDYPTPARRPLFSALNCDRFKNTFGMSLPPWELALNQCLE